VAFSGTISGQSAEKALSMVLKLEEVGDVGELIGLLVKD
jgi:hypothetical protein